MITVSTDGSCLRNPGGASGWAWVNHDGEFASGGIASGTNQVAELQAVLEAILAHPGADELRIESDSQYAIKCASVWVAGWKRKGWRTASGGPVKNLDLVQGIERAMAEREGKVVFHWVRGHQGDHFNERADVLAGAAARAAQKGDVVVTRSSPAPVPSPVVTPEPAAIPQPSASASSTPEPAADLLF